MRRYRAARGFTLVEVLLTLAIFSVVVVLLLSSFTGAERSRGILSERSHGFRQLRVSLDRIGADLQGAFASDAVETTALTCLDDAFSGKPASTLIFTAFVLPDPGGPRPAGDVVKLKYFPRLARDGSHIELYREESALPLIENRIATREVRMADRLLGFRVELFDGTAWTKEWPPAGRKKSALPRKVGLVLTDSEGREYRREIPLRLAGEEAAVPFSGKRKAAGQ